MLYDYVCKECGHELDDVLQSIKDKPKKKCPECGKMGLDRVIYGGAYAFVKNTGTIGQLADKNTRDMGHYKRSEIEEGGKKAARATEERKLRDSIGNMTPEQKRKYIMEGKK